MATKRKDAASENPGPAKKPAGPGNTVQLSAPEEREVEKRTGLRAEVVFETVRREGRTELRRAPMALAFSGLAAGLSMGFSLILTGLLRTHLPDAPWRVLFENIGYTAGFVIVILGRQQLFTENTVTVILPLLDSKHKLRIFGQVARLWAIVLGANLIGAAIIAYALAHTGVFDETVRRNFLQIGMQTIAPASSIIFARGIFAGWLLALMVWLLPAADTQKLFVILMVSYLVGVLGLSHVVAGSVDALYVVWAGHATLGTYFGHFLAPVFLGNALGGVLLVALLNYGQVAPEPENE